MLISEIEQFQSIIESFVTLMTSLGRAVDSEKIKVFVFV